MIKNYLITCLLRFFLCLLFSVCGCSLFCQNQNNQWRFGYNGGINFNSGSAVNVAGSQIETPEGSASVADKNTGALLFYTDGVTIWNANDVPMVNGTGLLGGTPEIVNPSNPLSSTSAAVIVSKPFTPDIYYVITIDQQDGTNGLRYSEVDMTLDAGLGAVTTGRKNIFLFNTSSEKLQVVPSSDGCGYWLITHDNPGNTFIVFKITQEGINTTPVLSSVGSSQQNGLGHLKVNRQFTKIAMGNSGFLQNSIELFDFNNTTGVVSNPISWDYTFPFSGLSFFGVEFSPDGSKLYVSNFIRVLQYNISLLTPALIQASGFNVTESFPLVLPGALQLGPDNKIYLASNPIAAINNPNNTGAACDLQLNPVPGFTGTAKYGLPQWIYELQDPVFDNKVLYADTCLASSTQFSLQNMTGVVSILWDFGDPSTGSSNTSTGNTPTHIFSQEGQYTVTAIASYACYEEIVKQVINIAGVSTSTTTANICTAELPYSWNGNSYTSGGTYDVTLVNIAGCDSIATLILNVGAASTSTTTANICTAQLPYNWNGNNYTSGGTYDVTLVNAVGCDSIATLILNVGAASTSTTTVNICTAQLPYSWNGNSYTSGGTYDVTLVNIAGCDSIATLILNVGATSASTTTANICTAQLPFAWNGNSYTSGGTYDVTLVNIAGCDSIATLILNVGATSASTTTVNICTAQLPFAWNGNNYTSGGTYAITLVNADGCDSIATLILNVGAASTSTTTANICTAQLPYSWNGNSYTSEGTYDVTMVNIAGCDSIATLILNVGATSASTTTVNICTAQLPFAWNGNNYTSGGTYAITLVNADGCDSIATLILNVGAASTSTTTANICTAQLPYAWNGNSYTSAGTYNVTLLGSTGCDSIATLILNIGAASTSTTTANICTADLPYSWNGNSYTLAGTYNITLVNTAGCDSIATLILNVGAASTSTTTVNICTAQLPYAWNGNNYTSGGTYNVTLLGSTGCDSIATLILNIGAVSTSTTTANICTAQLPYSWNGNSYTLAGTYNITLVNTAGCDSIATLILNVGAASTSTTTVNICTAQLPYSWNGNSYTTAGTYDVTLLGSTGCDSIATLILIVGAASTSTTNVNICTAQLPYVWNGNSYTSSGTYNITLVNTAGCDSIATLILNVGAVSTSTTTANICTAQLPYSWNGNIYTSGGTYDVTLVNTAGCDSIATLILNVGTASASTTTANICTAQLPYSWNGNIYTTAGTYNVTLLGSTGCDSIATLILNVGAASTSTTNVNICTAQLPYSWNGNIYTTAGTYNVTLLGSTGCDSIATLILNVGAASTSTTTVNICTAQLPYVWNGNSYTSSGTYNVTLLSSAGCDSIATLILNIEAASNSTTTANICTAQLPYAWNGNSYTSGGTYNVTLLGSAGCDSIATLILNVGAASTSTTTDNICTAQLPYSWNGNSYTSAGTYNVTLPGSTGCDSIATLILNVGAASTSTATVNICTAQLPYEWNGNSYTSAGTYNVTLLGSTGCDSIATLILNVGAASTSTTTVNICTAQLPYVWNGNSYTAGGTYNVTLLGSTGCDSIATLILNVGAASTSTTTANICTAQLPYEWNGNSYTSAGTYNVILLGSAGCDSIATLILNVGAASTSTTYVNICTAQLPYAWNGNSYTTAGTYDVILVNTAGCDSIATLILNVGAASTSTTTENICTAQLPYSWNGNSYTTAGTYNVTLLGSTGCDSIATLILNVGAASTSTTTANICTAQLPYEWNGNNYTLAGTYNVTLLGSTGCDSIATLILNIGAASTSTTTTNICTAQLPYSWNGNSYTLAGTYNITLVNTAGCDSISTLILNIGAASTSTTTANICTAQLPYIWNGNNYTSGGTYDVTLVNAAGCDSITTLILEIIESPQAPEVTSPVVYCEAAVPVPLSAMAASGNQLLWYSSATSGTGSLATPTPNTSNSGDFIYYVSQTNGVCESERAIIAVTVNGKPDLGPDTQLKTCPENPINLGSLYSVPNGSLIWTNNDFPVPNPASVNAPGLYQLVANSSFGCKDTVLVSLDVYTSPVANAGRDTTIESNQPYMLSGSGGIQYQWFPGAPELNNPSIANPVAILKEDRTFILTVEDQNGCKDSDTVKLRVLEGPALYVPNAFSPNRDGYNDVFKAYGPGIERLLYFRIFNRYGELIFETTDINTGWDGTYKGVNQNIGNYVWYIIAIDRLGKTRRMKGNVILTR